MSVCHSREPCKTAEPIEMPFGVCDSGWVHWATRWVCIIGTTWRTRLKCPCAATMRPYVKLLWPLVIIRPVIKTPSRRKLT